MSGDKGDARPLGIFDSGMGGLTVMRAVRRALPQERIIYLGDTARLPYGTKSADTVTRYALQAAEHLMARDVKAILVACNTASANALPALARAFDLLPIIGVVEPGAEAAVAATRSGNIAVIATEGTVRGGAYRAAIHARMPHAKVTEIACPLFVALAEEGLTQGEIVRLVAARYLDPVFGAGDARPDTLVLGCTHFPVLAEVIQQAAGKDVTLVDSAETAAADLARVLAARGLLSKGPAQSPQFLATDAAARFARIGQLFLSAPINEVQVTLVDLSA